LGLLGLWFQGVQAFTLQVVWVEVAAVVVGRVVHGPHGVGGQYDYGYFEEWGQFSCSEHRGR
jgi:hypothetical protein